MEIMISCPLLITGVLISIWRVSIRPIGFLVTDELSLENFCNEIGISAKLLSNEFLLKFQGVLRYWTHIMVTKIVRC